MATRARARSARAAPSSPLKKLPPLRMFRDGSPDPPPVSVLEEICRKLEGEQAHPATSGALVRWWWRVRVPLVTFGRLLAHATRTVEARVRREKITKGTPWDR